LLHWSFDDPASVPGTEAEQQAAFRRGRDEIADRIARFVNEHATQ
jgi:hypothetical protein